MSIQAALEAVQLYRFYRTGEDETLALRGVDLQVAPGEVVAVVGPSGSGKSTLLACLAGLDEPAGGTVRISGVRISHRPEDERAALRARHVGVLLQSRNLMPHLSLTDNITLARAAAPGSSTVDVIESVGLGTRRHALAHQLSGGELARAGLAVALANGPDVLLADEPTGELDGDTEQQILTLLHEQASDGTAVLVVTHSDAVTASADRVVRLLDGAIA